MNSIDNTPKFEMLYVSAFYSSMAVYGCTGYNTARSQHSVSNLYLYIVTNDKSRYQNYTEH